MKIQILLPVRLISWTFMPKIEDARLVGTNTKANIVTGSSMVSKMRYKEDFGSPTDLYAFAFLD